MRARKDWISFWKRGHKMGRQAIKDATGKLLGSIDTNPNGREQAYDSQGHIVGSYDPNSNTTKTTTGTLLAQGNALAGLISSKDENNQRSSAFPPECGLSPLSCKLGFLLSSVARKR
jgi:YD repeat-containing protein